MYIRKTKSLISNEVSMFLDKYAQMVFVILSINYTRSFYLVSYGILYHYGI
jgi:hypothetical protein